MNNTDTAYFQCKNGCRNRCAKQGRKHSAHPAEYGNSFFFFIQLQEPSGIISETASDLQGCTFPPGTSPEKMRNDRADENNREKENVDPASEQDRINNIIRALPFCMSDLVESNYSYTADRKEPDQPGICLTQSSYGCNTFIENTADQPAYESDQDGDPEPF